VAKAANPLLDSLVGGIDLRHLWERAPYLAARWRDVAVRGGSTGLQCLPGFRPVCQSFGEALHCQWSMLGKRHHLLQGCDD
jgi:hypothetical protein